MSAVLAVPRCERCEHEDRTTVHRGGWAICDDCADDLSQRDHRPALDLAATFSSAESAWMWAMRLILQRAASAPAARGSEPPRCCTPDDLVMALDRLYRQRRIDLGHAHVLRVWGERGEVPEPRTHATGQDQRMWREAMAALGSELRVRGIVR